MALATLPFLVPLMITGFASALESEEFVDILFGYRHAYQLPSRISLTDLLAALAFTGAVGLAFAELGKAAIGNPTRAGIAAVFVLIAGAMLAGWFFVEVVPTRLMATAWVYRLAQVWAWLGWILIAGLAAHLLVARDWRWAAVSVMSAANSIWLFGFNAFSFWASRWGGGKSAELAEAVHRARLGGCRRGRLLPNILVRRATGENPGWVEGPGEVDSGRVESADDRVCPCGLRVFGGGRDCAAQAVRQGRLSDAWSGVAAGSDVGGGCSARVRPSGGRIGVSLAFWQAIRPTSR